MYINFNSFQFCPIFNVFNNLLVHLQKRNSKILHILGNDDEAGMELQFMAQKNNLKKDNILEG